MHKLIAQDIIIELVLRYKKPEDAMRPFNFLVGTEEKRCMTLQ